MTPDEVRERAVRIGAWWMIGVEEDAVVRGIRAIRAGGEPDVVAGCMGSDVHAALVLMGMVRGYERGGE